MAGNPPRVPGSPRHCFGCGDAFIGRSEFPDIDRIVDIDDARHRFRGYLRPKVSCEPTRVHNDTQELRARGSVLGGRLGAESTKAHGHELIDSLVERVREILRRDAGIGREKRLSRSPDIRSDRHEYFSL